MEDKNEAYLAQIAELRAENAALHGEVDSLQTSFQTLCTTLNEVVRLVSQMNGDVRDNTHNNTVLYNRLCNLPYEILDKRFAEKYEIPRIMTLEETIDEIVLHKKSIARFGDGEFGIMFGVSRWRFQREDEKLAERLREVIASNEENLLIGLNDFYGDLSHRTEADADGIRAYIVKARAQHMKLLQKGRLYAHACISRTGSLEKVQNQKRIWEGRDCVFVEGDKTRMGVGNDLFDNAKSIQRILCPSESAFDNYDAILEACKKLPKDKTILIALGPTASVLAYDLAKAGYHAIDIGHADLAYEWFLRSGSSKKAAVHYKYNNEYPEGYIVEDIHDEKYESEIIADLSGS
ncbi:MAG: GT-D fold domain-containing protein [Lachnospiraceae bacterium]